MKNFSNKVAVITGAAEGIGKAIALRAATEKMKLVLVDINSVQLEVTVAEIKKQGVDVIGICTDVSDAASVDALATEVFSRFGNVHLLINNAGVALAKPVWETTQQDWDWVMGVNLYGVTNSLRAFIPAMLKNDEEGYIVNTASMAGLLSRPGLAAYNASKHAVVTVTEGLHYDLNLRNSKIKVSVLCPFWVKTNIAQAARNRPSVSESGHDPVTASIEIAIFKAVKRGISVDEVANAVFAAIVDERFYILTDLNVLPQIQARMENILSQNLPDFFDKGLT